MRKNLQDAEIERQKVFSETQKRSLIQEGITEITEILQLNYQNVEELSYQVISSLVKYLNAGQGGIFFAEKNKFGNNVLILKAAYAFDKKKKLEAEIEFGESLVGRCAKEKEMIYLEHLPQGYTVITSGLGGETPSVLVLSPLLFENNVYGVLEIASFNKFEDFQIEFIKLISERVASVVSNLQINSETAALLEQSRKQSEELEAKEREMVNTISELEKVQVDILMREAENKGIMTAVNSIASVTYFDMEGRVTNINQKNLESFGMFKHDVIGKNHFQLLAEARENPEWFEQFWNDLREGKQRTKEYYIQFENKELWLYETFTPILNKDGFPEKVINIGIDITAQKLLERELEKINSTKL